MPEISRFYGIVIRMYFADHNPRSHRAGLLTLEHQGCPAFAGEDEEGYGVRPSVTSA